MTGPADAAAGSAGAEDADAAGTGLMPGDGARRRSSSTSSESRPFERASPVRTVMSESPVAESFVPSKTPTKRSPAPRFTLGSLEGSPESPPRLAKAMARSETQSSSNTVTQATAGAGSPRGDRVERAPSGNLAAKPPAVDATPVGLRKVEVVEISPIAASPDDMDEDEIEAAEGEVGQRLREDEDDTDDEDEDITDDDEPDRDTPDGSDEDDVGDTIGDEDDPDSDDSGERERPRTFRAKPFRKPIPPTAAAPKAEEKVATSVSSNSSILSTKSSAAGDAKDGKASDALKRETSSGKVCLAPWGFSVQNI